MSHQIDAALRSEEIPLLRSELHRVSFDHALYEQLLSPIPNGELSLVRGSAEQMLSCEDEIPEGV
jgi:hypothetical protein